MTRINLCDLFELCDQHLLSEWRELPRVPNAVAKGRAKIKDIPDEYTIQTSANPKGGKGHVKFFYNKMLFLRKRYEDILDECCRRGFNVTDNWPDYDFPPELCNDYSPTLEAKLMNKTRINERIADGHPRNPRYYGKYMKF